MLALYLVLSLLLYLRFFRFAYLKVYLIMKQPHFHMTHLTNMFYSTKKNG